MKTFRDKLHLGVILSIFLLIPFLVNCRKKVESKGYENGNIPFTIEFRSSMEHPQSPTLVHKSYEDVEEIFVPAYAHILIVTAQKINVKIISIEGDFYSEVNTDIRKGVPSLVSQGLGRMKLLLQTTTKPYIQKELTLISEASHILRFSEDIADWVEFSDYQETHQYKSNLLETKSYEIPVVIYPSDGSTWVVEETQGFLKDIELKLDGRNPKVSFSAVKPGRATLKFVNQTNQKLVSYLQLNITETTGRPTLTKLYPGYIKDEVGFMYRGIETELTIPLAKTDQIFKIKGPNQGIQIIDQTPKLKSSTYLGEFILETNTETFDSIIQHEIPMEVVELIEFGAKLCIETPETPLGFCQLQDGTYETEIRQTDCKAARISAYILKNIGIYLKDSKNQFMGIAHSNHVGIHESTYNTLKFVQQLYTQVLTFNLKGKSEKDIEEICQIDREIVETIQLKGIYASGFDQPQTAPIKIKIVENNKVIHKTFQKNIGLLPKNY